MDKKSVLLILTLLNIGFAKGTEKIEGETTDFSSKSLSLSSSESEEPLDYESDEEDTFLMSADPNKAGHAAVGYEGTLVGPELLLTWSGIGREFKEGETIAIGAERRSVKGKFLITNGSGYNIILTQIDKSVSIFPVQVEPCNQESSNLAYVIPRRSFQKQRFLQSDYNLGIGRFSCEFHRFKKILFLPLKEKESFFVGLFHRTEGIEPCLGAGIMNVNEQGDIISLHGMFLAPSHAINNIRENIPGRINDPKTKDLSDEDKKAVNAFIHFVKNRNNSTHGLALFTQKGAALTHHMNLKIALGETIKGEIED